MEAEMSLSISSCDESKIIDRLLLLLLVVAALVAAVVVVLVVVVAEVGVLLLLLALLPLKLCISEGKELGLLLLGL